MKMTKRFMTMAVCGVMAAASLVGISASATNDDYGYTIEKIGTIDLLSNNTKIEGVYTNQSDSSSFISINVNGTGTCFLENVYCGTDSVYVRGKTDLYALKNEDEAGYFTATLNGKYLIRKGTDGSWNTSTLTNSQITGTLYTVKNWWNVVQYYVIKIGEGTSNEQVFIQG